MTRIGVLFVSCVGLAAPVLGQNLVVNGDFELGNVSETGWTTWSGGWGSFDPPQYNNTQPGHRGNYCLRLSTSASSSFGVYQQVTVTPGRTYRLSAYWKGKYFSQGNWYEILLIDGPFSLSQADDHIIDKPNFMYAYDPPDCILTADFGWIWTADQNGTPVDWNNYRGMRTATGNVMTVVLKAGCFPDISGVSGWFDDVTLVEVPTPPPQISLSTQAINRSVRRLDSLSNDTFTVSNNGGGTLNYTITDDQSWLSVSPTSGDSTGPSDVDTVTVSYAVESLTPGTYHATIMVRDLAATNDPRTIAVTVQVTAYPADLDLDGDVDLSDFSFFQLCFNGPNRAPGLNCSFNADFDGDGDVDLTDFAVFQGCFNGPNRAPACR